MRTDKFVGVLLSLGSLGVALLGVMYFAGNGETIPWAVLIWPAVVFLIGIVMIFSDVLENELSIMDELKKLPELLEDEREAISHGEITAPILYAVFVVVAMLAQVFLMVYYRKWIAHWGIVNVSVVALLVVLLTSWIVLKTDWFQTRRYLSSWYIFAIPAGAWVICAAIGVYWAEPSEYRAMSPLERSQIVQSDSYWGSTRGGNIYIFNDYSGSSSGVSIDCHGDSCGGLALLLVALVCIAGSAIIPHFWVVATWLLLTIIILVAIRELLYSPNERSLKYRYER